MAIRNLKDHATNLAFKQLPKAEIYYLSHEGYTSIEGIGQIAIGVNVIAMNVERRYTVKTQTSPNTWQSKDHSINMNRLLQNTHRRNTINARFYQPLFP